MMDGKALDEAIFCPVASLLKFQGKLLHLIKTFTTVSIPDIHGVL